MNGGCGIGFNFQFQMSQGASCGQCPCGPKPQGPPQGAPCCGGNKPGRGLTIKIKPGGGQGKPMGCKMGKPQKKCCCNEGGPQKKGGGGGCDILKFLMQLIKQLMQGCGGGKQQSPC